MKIRTLKVSMKTCMLAAGLLFVSLPAVNTAASVTPWQVPEVGTMIPPQHVQFEAGEQAALPFQSAKGMKWYFTRLGTENGQYYIMDGIKGVWQGDGIERFTVYDFSTGTKNVVGECKVDYYASEESAERAANRGQSLVSQQEADEIYNGRIARWNDGVVVLIECMIY